MRESPLNLQFFMLCWFFVTMAAVGTYDIYAVLWLGPNSTVSYELYQLGKRMPTLYLAVGILIGHIILPLHVHEPGDVPVIPNGGLEKHKVGKVP